MSRSLFRILRSGLILVAFTVAALVAGIVIGRGSVSEPEIFFSPGTACTDHAVDVIDHAKREIAVDAYGFSHPRVIDALAMAQRRGVHVDLVLDRSDANARATAGREAGAVVLAKAGASVRFDYDEPIHHDKVIIADGDVIFSGSWNLTRQAERNAENCRVDRSEKIASKFLADHARHRAHAEAAP